MRGLMGLVLHAGEAAERTPVSALLTALLAAVTPVSSWSWAGIGGISTKPPSWAVAGPTIAAALCQPARHRIHTAVDRRFNRRKDNTAKTIGPFATRLRDQANFDASPPSCWRPLTRHGADPSPAWLQPSPHGSSGTLHREARPAIWAD
jgi:hypothetical protein